MSGRRQFMKAISTASAGLVVPATAVASNGDTKTGAAEIGVEDSIRKNLQKGKHSEAVKILEEYDIDYTGKNVQMPTVGDDKDQDSSLTPNNEWGKDKSNLGHYSFHQSGDIYHSNLYWELKGGGGRNEYSSPRDGVGITFNPDLWEPVLESTTQSDRVDLLDGVNSYGLAGKYNDPENPLVGDDPPGYTTGYIGMDMEKTESGSHNIYGKYEHTWSLTGLGSIDISFGVGPIEVSIPMDAYSWHKTNNNNI